MWSTPIFALLTLALPLAVPPPAGQEAGLAPRFLAETAGALDPCALGEQIARMKPCRDPDDCAALDLWREGLGEPGLRRLGPPGTAPPAARPVAATSGGPNREPLRSAEGLTDRGQRMRLFWRSTSRAVPPTRICPAERR